MGFLATVLAIILSLVIGFVFGALVYRNNGEQLGKLADTIIDLSEQIKDLKK